MNYHTQLGGIFINNFPEADSLVDIQGIDLSGKDMLENAKQFFEKIKDPYHFRVDDIIVHVQFGDQTAGCLQSRIQDLLSKAGVNFT